jgi:hypothetical protein
MIYFYSTSQLKQLSQVKCGANSMAKVEVPLSSETSHSQFVAHIFKLLSMVLETTAR